MCTADLLFGIEGVDGEQTSLNNVPRSRSLVEEASVGLFTTRCPVDYREQTWIEESMSWFRTTSTRA